MFDRLFRRAERKIDSVVSKYVRRIVVAVPLVIAALFATLALSVKLVELYGATYGYAMMAGGFALLSAIIALFTLTGEDQSPAASPAEDKATASPDDKQEADDDAPLVPPELLSVITAAVPVALPGVARLAARNLPMLIALAILGYLFARYAGRTASPDETAEPSAAPPADAEDAAVSMATQAAAA